MYIAEVDFEDLRKERIIDSAFIMDLNKLITEPETAPEALGSEDQSVGRQRFQDHELNDKMLGREEDYHERLSPGVVETLTQIILPKEHQQGNTGALWLSSVVIQQICQHQAFGEGNKRTAYWAGQFFLLNSQRLAGERKGFYWKLDNQLVDEISDLAVQNITREEFYDNRVEELKEEEKNFRE